MLIVRQVQMEALEALSRERFVQLMLAHLAERFPRQSSALGEPNVRHLIASGIAKAEAFGLRAEQDVAGLIHFMFEADPDFDRRLDHGWAVAALRHPGLEPGERVDRLFAEWRERRNGAPAAGRPHLEGASICKAPGSAVEPGPMGTIRVAVRRSNDQRGIGGATVSIGEARHPAVTRPGAGTAAFAQIAPGEYTVSVTLLHTDLPGYQAPPPRTVILQPGSTATVLVEVEPLATVTVQVTEKETGRGIAGAGVALTSAASHAEGREARTGEDGCATLQGIRRGRFRLVVTLPAADIKRYRRSAPVPEFEVQAGETVTLRCEVLPLVVQPVRLMKRSARPDAIPAPIGDVTVILQSRDEGELTARTDPETGVALVEAVPPGEYTLEIDLGSQAGRFKSYAPMKLIVGAISNAEALVELEPVHCQFTDLRVQEIRGRVGPAGLGEELGRAFAIQAGLGCPAGGMPSGTLRIEADGSISLVAPRKADLFQDPDQPLSPLPFDPPAGAFREGIEPTWLEIELGAQPHVLAGTSIEPNHPAVVVRNADGQKLVEVAGTRRPGRFVIWGPDSSWTIAPPARANRGLRRVEGALRAFLASITECSATPAVWEVVTGYCDPDGNPAERRVPLVILPGDQYRLQLDLPALQRCQDGASGEYIKGREVASTHGATRDEEGDATVFARRVEGQYQGAPAVKLTRNGRDDPNTAPVKALASAVAAGAAETVKWLCQLDNLVPQWGWWVTADIALLRGSLTAEWGWRPKAGQNDAEWLYQVRLAGTLLDLKLGIKAGLQAAIVPGRVSFCAIVYLQLSGSADTEWSWTSDQRPARQQVASTTRLDVGIDLAIGKANFCQAKEWVKAPYTFEWNVLPLDSVAEPTQATRHVDFSQRCQDGVYVVAKYQLFYGRYQGTQKVELKQPVELD